MASSLNSTIGDGVRTTNVPVVATARKDLYQTKENVLSGLKDVKEDRLSVLKVDFLGKTLDRRQSYSLS